MKPVLYLKGSTELDVRLQKFIKFFKSISIPITFFGWDRQRETKPSSKDFEYVLKGGGYNNKLLYLYYPLWVIKLFFKLLFLKQLNKYNVIAINFECGLPIYLVSKIRKIDYIYEVYDEFALSHNFPNNLKKFIIHFDKKIMRRAKFVIHVDKNRDNYPDCKTIIIENSPNDYFHGNQRTYDNLSHKFAIIGNISKGRGIGEIYKFVINNPGIEFILVGTFYDKEFKDQFIKLPNVEYFDRMLQEELFAKLGSCVGIFSLYDASLEINRLAASNKVYDAMMLGIPVITNPEVINSKFIMDENIGVIVNYFYDESWDVLASPEFLDKAKLIGSNGRKLYLNRYLFEKMLEQRLLPEL